jgi:uncharacterized protein YciI
MRRRHFAAAAAALALPALARAAADDLWFIFLEKGRPTPPDKEAVMAMQRGHIENFKRLFALGKLFSAGPLADPSGFKRGIVTVRAASRDELMGYFQPDDYVREGYMTVNAVPATAHKALNTEGIDASKVEEVRIVLVPRSAPAPAAALKALVDAGTVGAWYTLKDGPVADVLFARSTDTAALEAALAPHSSGALVWKQWLSPGVVR